MSDPGAPLAAPSRPPSARAFERVWLAASMGLVVALTWHHMDLLGDGFWYLASGDWVLGHQALPETDPFSFASTHGPWILHFPASQIAFAWLARHAGLTSVLALATIVSAAAGLVPWLVSARSAPARALGLVVLLGAIELGRDDLSARGQVFGDLGYAILFLCMLRLRRGERVAPWVPFALGAVWTNFHASFLLAIVFPLVVAAALLFDPGTERPSLRPFVRFSLIALAATGLNPYSYVLVVDVLRLSLGHTTAEVDLFQSPDFHSPAWLAAMASAALLMLLRVRHGEAQHRRSDLAVLAVLVLLACSARRFGSLLATAELVLAMRLVDRRAFDPLRPGASKTLLALAIALELAVGARLLAEPKDPLAQVPRDAAAFIVDRGLPDRVFNPYHWGGYLDWVWHLRRKTFIDGRNNLFENGVFDDAATIEAAGPAALDLLDVYEIRTVLVERGSPLDALLARYGAYERVFVERLAAVYVRRH